ncbi:hypothetical protein AGABI1DRAFT_111678 [Agaricus bisporus var. burnettii JB137-S8]|uniref:Uncharacterized protein n=2 Tax=Agaricus bisporus var. burnettii TaxID=192524 RepID=K5X5U0_AGABU|nr:hypothetical protein AGABI2DRAFT_190915 [Agaricus bisporus var. bisporus H97]XP_007327017.1 uncharacterized protein AGABI1DRAFT_111678 [Agaricus bisporus var. burnettii JB137-S8]EKM83226.1 hypothetical protein AGABI1DRAFT_111678 [Agaricus bisporus var. burnettii JB137-S8]EKV50665.1 hypothetical protein AGABI2DRAFT_190915 [Agaricus bisporus var. bisporus H97]KAF7777695.1 hypothetical protein Agabi119p4_3767 [Agaricus bisporus var. burnettii]
MLQSRLTSLSNQRPGLPEELSAIFRFIHVFETFPGSKDFIEATFVVMHKDVQRSIPPNRRPILKATFQVPLLGHMEKALAEYIENATQNSPHISTRIFFLISLRTTLTRILVKLAVMENAEPCYIHVRTAKAEWMIDIRNQTDPLPQLVSLRTSG